MKKIGLLFITGLFTLGLTAQNTDAGTIHIGATSNLNFDMMMTTEKTEGDDGILGTSDDEDVDNNTAFNLSLRGGYFPIDNMVAGVFAGYTMEKQGDYDFSGMSYGVYTRYYLMEGKLYAGASYASMPDPNGQIPGWLQATFDSYSLVAASLGETLSLEAKISTIGLSAGYVHWFNDNVTLEPSVYFNMSKPVWELKWGDETEEIDPEDLGIEGGVKKNHFGLLVNLGFYLN